MCSVHTQEVVAQIEAGFASHIADMNGSDGEA